MPFSRYVTPIEKDLNMSVTLHSHWLLAQPSRKCGDGDWPVYIGYQYVCRNDKVRVMHKHERVKALRILQYFLSLLLYHTAEWAVIIIGGIYLLTFAVEYRQVQLQVRYWLVEDVFCT